MTSGSMRPCARYNMVNMVGVHEFGVDYPSLALCTSLVWTYTHKCTYAHMHADTPAERRILNNTQTPGLKGRDHAQREYACALCL